jgi:hypothetical protein
VLAGASAADRVIEWRITSGKSVLFLLHFC